MIIIFTSLPAQLQLVIILFYLPLLLLITPPVLYRLTDLVAYLCVHSPFFHAARPNFLNLPLARPGSGASGPSLRCASSFFSRSVVHYGSVHLSLSRSLSVCIVDTVVAVTCCLSSPPSAPPLLLLFLFLAHLYRFLFYIHSLLSLMLASLNPSSLSVCLSVCVCLSLTPFLSL